MSTADRLLEKLSTGRERELTTEERKTLHIIAGDDAKAGKSQALVKEAVARKRADARLSALQAAMGSPGAMQNALGESGRRVYTEVAGKIADAYRGRGIGDMAEHAADTAFGKYYRDGYNGGGFVMDENMPVDGDYARQIYEAGKRDAEIDRAGNLTERSGLTLGVDRAQIATAVRLSSTLGRRIVFVEGEGFRGFSDGETIYLHAKLNSTQMVVRTAAHEFVHTIEHGEGYAKLKKFVFAILTKGKTVDDLREEKRNASSVYAALPDKDIDREIVAAFVEENLIDDEKMLRRIVGGRYGSVSLGQKILRTLDAILRKIKAALSGDKNAADAVFVLERGRNILADAIRSAEAAEKDDGEVRFALNEYIEKSLRKENVKDYQKYGTASQKLINDIVEYNLEGFSHALRDNDIRHLVNSHGEKTSEKYPVTVDDIKRIPEIVENYDKVFFNVHNGKNSVIYVKVSAGGITYYVEQATEILGNEKLLINKQMIKTGINDIPSVYLSAITKKEGKTEFLNDLKKSNRSTSKTCVGIPSIPVYPIPSKKVKRFLKKRNAEHYYSGMLAENSAQRSDIGSASDNSIRDTDAKSQEVFEKKISFAAEESDNYTGGFTKRPQYRQEKYQRFYERRNQSNRKMGEKVL